MADFSGVRAKFDRAREHAEHLKREIDGYLKDKSGLTGRPEVECDPQTGHFVARWSGDPTCPVEWSVMLGEFFHDLRSALDYIAWIVVEYHDPNRLSERVAFPICTDNVRFKAAFETKLPGVRRESGYGAAFESVQPYNVSEEQPHSSILWLIQRLNNIDKHRLLHVVTHRVSEAGFSFTIGDQEFDVPLHQFVTPGMPLKDKTVLTQIPFGPEDIQSEVQMQVYLAFYVGFGETRLIQDGDELIEGLSVKNVLDLCINYVDEVLLPSFESLWDYTVQLTPRHKLHRSDEEE